VPPGDFIAPEPSAHQRRRGKAPVYAIAVDPTGKIRWESNDMRGDWLVVLTTAKAPAGYLADLRKKSISYLLAGRDRIDFASALERLARHFGIRKLMLEGGGSLNGSLLAAGLVDEISLLVCPYADGLAGAPSVFDCVPAKPTTPATALRLMAVRKRPGGVVWLRYRRA
jgi:riboflavin biosynthesis pyrimidine reductase